MNKPVYLGLSVLELCKILIYEFQYDYVKATYGEKVKFCYMDTNNFYVYKKAGDIYKDVAEDAETRSDTSNYKLDRPLPKERNDEVIGLMKDGLVGKIMKKFVGLRVKIYSYLIDDNNEGKKAKVTRKCAIK